MRWPRAAERAATVWVATAFLAYVVVLLAHLPQITRWLGSNGDDASAYVLARTVAHGGAGPVTLGTQGAWLSLGIGALTAGLGAHRVLWEALPVLAGVGTALLVAWSVARVSRRRSAGALAVVLIVAASPTALQSLVAPWLHNTTTLAVAGLGAFVVWLHERPRAAWVLGAVGLATTLLAGACLASDWLLISEGIAPLALCSLVSLQGVNREPGRAAVMSAVALGGVGVGTAIDRVMRGAGFLTVAPPVHLALSHLALHGAWLLAGLLRLGGAWPVVAESPLRDFLTALAACALLAGAAAGCAVVRHTLGRGRERAADPLTAHVSFWACAAACATIAYLATAEVPSDRYVLIVVVAAAAIVPLRLHDRAARLGVLLAAAVFVTTNLVGLAAGDMRHGLQRADVSRQVGALTSIVAREHLGVGYAGYWEAAPLDWLSRGRLTIHPLGGGSAAPYPSRIASAAAWYRPRPHTPSFLLLAPGDRSLKDAIPVGWPRPAREVRVGQFTLAIYRFDIARLLRP